MISRAAIEAVLAPFGEARPFPADAYLDANVFAFERSALFDRGWVCVGHEEDVAQPGAWIRTPFERLVVTRGEDLALHGLVDVCRHRSATLLDGERGRASKLVCPYHGWVYEPSGALRLAPDAPAGFDRAAHDLCRARVATFAGLLFVNRSADAEPFPLGDVPPFLERAQLGRLRVGHRAAWETGANWKLVIENFQESHHFPLVHPGLEHWTPASRSSSFFSEQRDGPWFGGTMDLVDAAETVSTDGLRHDRPFVAPEEDRRLVHDAHLFPSLLLSVQPDYALIYRLFPRAVDRTRIDFSILFHPAAFSPDFAPTDVIDHWERTNAEDRAVCERQQEGLAAGVGPGCYTRSEDGVHAFDRLIARRYLEQLERLERSHEDRR